MGNIYIGNSSNIAKEIKSLYVGVNGIARKVKQVYVGDVNNIARLVWEDVKNESYFLLGVGRTESYGSGTRNPFYTVNKNDYSCVTNNYNATQFSTSSETYTKISKQNASVTVTFCDNAFYFSKKNSSNIYNTLFTKTISELVALTPNSGETAFIHSSWDSSYGYSQTNGFGLSGDGKHFYFTYSASFNSTSTGYNNILFKSMILIYNISSGTPVFEREIVLYNMTTTSYYGHGIIYVDSDDNLDVFVATFGYTYSLGSSTYYPSFSHVYIGSISSGYSAVSAPNLEMSAGTYYNTQNHSMCVSRNGKYMAYLVYADNPQSYVYSNKVWLIAKIDKSARTLTYLGRAHDDYIVANTDIQGFIGDEYFYHVYTTSSYADDGSIYLRICKINGNTISVLTNYYFPDPYYSGSNLHPYDSNLRDNVHRIAIDIKNNILIYSAQNSSMYRVCHLQGSNGSYSTHTSTGSDRYYLPNEYYTSVNDIYIQNAD